MWDIDPLFRHIQLMRPLPHDHANVRGAHQSLANCPDAVAYVPHRQLGVVVAGMKPLAEEIQAMELMEYIECHEVVIWFI
jgi:hypothetical protein